MQNEDSVDITKIETYLSRKSDDFINFPVPAHVKGEYKYDFVKVRVWLADHFYVLSRYILSRALVGTKVAPQDAVKIALEVKKTLVGLGLLDIVQEQFEDYLYKTMMMYRYNEIHVSRYRMMSSFHHKRVPLLILLSGTGCIGKSSIASKLAERFNLPSVLQTNIVLEMMTSLSRILRESSPSVSLSRFNNEEDLLKHYQKECEIVREGVHFDIQKCFKEGKAIIIEGSHIDPAHYRELMDCEAADIGMSETASDGAPAYGIIVPFILTLNQVDHKNLMQSAPSSEYCRKLNDPSSTANESELQEILDLQLNNFQAIQRYLVFSSTSQALQARFKIVPTNIYSFNETLDTLHDAVLERIEAQYHQKKW